MLFRSMHFAVHGNTAAEVIVQRANHQKEHMGLTSWRNAPHGKIVKTDVSIAKNYLSAPEMQELNEIVTMYLDYAARQARRHIPVSYTHLFIAELIWSAGRKNDSKYISVSHEYILAYFRDAQFIRDNKIVWREKKQGLEDIYAKYEALKREYGDDYKAMEKELKAWYKGLPDGHPAKDHSHYNKVDDRGVFFASDISWPGGGGPKYVILHPITNKPVKIPSRGWITNRETMLSWVESGKVNFGDDETAVPTIKSYLSEHEYGVRCV